MKPKKVSEVKPVEAKTATEPTASNPPVGAASVKEHPLKNAAIPGNKQLSEDEKAKLPVSRKNRYGAFPPSEGNTEFDRAVANQRLKMQPKKNEVAQPA